MTEQDRIIIFKTDCFANTPINQARALSELLNEFFGL